MKTFLVYYRVDYDQVKMICFIKSVDLSSAIFKLINITFDEFFRQLEGHYDIDDAEEWYDKREQLTVIELPVLL